MIKKLKIKFISIIMLIMTVLLLIVFVTLNVTMSQLSKLQSLNIMRNIIRNENQPKLTLPQKLPFVRDNPKTPSNQDYFLVKIDNNLLEIASNSNRYSEEEMKQLVKLALQKKTRFGTVSNERFLIESKPYGQLVLFVDNTIEKNLEIRLAWISVAICSGSLIFIFLISLVLSDWAIKPVKLSFEKQKQFVADASHELKTPLTILAANIDVLRNEIGENKWLSFMKAETSRMSELTNNLLYLAKHDGDENIYNIKEFNLSEAILSVVLPFESVAYEQEKTMTFAIDEHMMVKGDENRIKQVVVILLDNAIKNCNPNGNIHVCLALQGNKKAISIYNSGEGIRPEDKEKIFERFYRGDASRARDTGGSGLGLSIAQTIIAHHNGKILVESEPKKGAKFTVLLP